MRREVRAPLDAVATNMHALSLPYKVLETYADDVTALRRGIAELRDEVRRGFRQGQADFVQAENQNISRHGETLALRPALDEMRHESPFQTQRT